MRHASRPARRYLRAHPARPRSAEAAICKPPRRRKARNPTSSAACGTTMGMSTAIERWSFLASSAHDLERLPRHQHEGGKADRRHERLEHAAATAAEAGREQIHGEMTAVVGDRGGGKEDRPDRQKDHRLVRPIDRGQEHVARDHVGEVDRDCDEAAAVPQASAATRCSSSLARASSLCSGRRIRRPASRFVRTSCEDLRGVVGTDA